LQLVCRTRALSAPFATDHSCYLLVECAAHDDPTDRLAQAVAGLEGVRDVAVAIDPARRAELWEYREAHTEAINALGPPHKLDVTLPAERLAEFAAEVERRVLAARPAAAVWLFGHAIDGNLHVNVTGLAPDDEIDGVVLELVAELGGSISAEHGIGTAKKKWLHLSRSEAEIDTFRRIKRALDPAGILNPAVLLP
jgi:FAD/FMN-containing dehydrogenase